MINFPLKFSFLFLVFAGLLLNVAYAQLGMNGQPHPSAAFDVKSTDKAFYPPRMTTSQREAIVRPQAGAFVYDTDKGTFFMHNGQGWLPLAFTTVDNLPPTTLTAPDGAAGDSFGSVALADDYLFVGAAGADIDGKADQGAVYVFFKGTNGWAFQTKLTAADGAAGDRFGSDVSTSGQYVLIGASDDDVSASNQGSAYVFSRTGSVFTQQSKLVAPDAGSGNDFGQSVSLSGNYALVGAPTHTYGSGTQQGAAYVFTLVGNAWNYQAKLIHPSATSQADFGASVAISGDYALIGAPNDRPFQQNFQGSAHIFVRSGTSWSYQTLLNHFNPQPGDFFGSSVSLSGNYAIVGAPYKTVGNTVAKGMAFTYLRNGTAWPLQASLEAPGGETQDRFGTSVVIVGDYALVGQPADDIGPNTDQGSVWLFRRSGTAWPAIRLLTNGNSPSLFTGTGLALSGTTYAIGAAGYLANQGNVFIGLINP